jgi:signal peptidase I
MAVYLTVQVSYVVGESMWPTLAEQDILVADRISPIHRGDVVLVSDTTADGLAAIRVIGLPGDEVSCCDALGRLALNSQPLEEHYTNSGWRQTGPTRVAPGQVLTLPDNREAGPAPRQFQTRRIVGRVFLIHDERAGWQFMGTPNAYQGAGLVPPGERIAVPFVLALATAAYGLLLLGLGVAALVRLARRRRGATRSAQHGR